MIVYLGAPIDKHAENPLVNFDVLEKMAFDIFGDSCVCYNPLTAFRGAAKCRLPSTNDYIYKVNKYALLQAEICLFIVDNQPSFGVPLEINMAADVGKPVYILNKIGTAGVYLQRFADICLNVNIFKTKESMMSAMIKDNKRSSDDIDEVVDHNLSLNQ